MGKQLVLTATQTARILGVGKSTIYRRVTAETLAGRYLNDRLMIPLSALKKTLDPAKYDAVKSRLTLGEDPVPAAKPAKKPAMKAKR